MRAPGIVLVEDSPYESALAYLALSRNAPSVIPVKDLRAAARLASGGGVGMAILGSRAIARISDRHVRALGVPAVGIGTRLTAEERSRALAAGVKAVYRRPSTWQAYLALIARLVAPIRRDSARRRARSS
jgi:hypothetical protein